MKRKSPDTIISRFVTLSTAAILVLMPFHAFLTVWLSSGIGHYTALRLWKEVLLLFAGLAALWLVYRSSRLRKALFGDWLWRLITAYALLTIVCGLVAHALGNVTTKAVLYGELLNLRPFLMLGIAWVAASLAPFLYEKWRQLVLLPATGVVAIGLLQYLVLPYDVMKHFGYNANTIGPYETIDHKVAYIRIRSTLRGANLLGGYMLIVLAAISDVLLAKRRQLLAGVGVLAAFVALYASGSRGAWLGAVPTALVLLWLRLPSLRSKQIMLLIAAAATLIFSGAVLVLRNNDFVQNIVFHTDEHSTSSVSSNSAHISYSVDAAKQILTEPFGRGPGTAGPASAYNTGHPARIAENNFLQIGQ